MEQEKLRILIIDDDPDVLTLCEKLLAGTYEVLTATSGRKGIEILSSIEIDGLLSDINMPEMDGFQVLKNVKKIKALDGLTIAMLTGVRERKDIERAVQMGASDYIVKPIDPMLFLKKIENLFHNKTSSKNEINFVRIQMETPAFLKNRIKIVTVSEMGICISSKIEQKTGEIVELDFDLFDELKIRAPHMKVLSCKLNDKKEWITHLGFVGASEAIRQKLRAWIYKQSTKNKAVA